MKFLPAPLILIFAFGAVASEEIPGASSYKSIARGVGGVKITGDAAQAIYESLGTREVVLGSGAGYKGGTNIGCTKGFPQSQDGYVCSMLLVEETGQLEADGILKPLPSIGGSSR